MGQAGAEGGAQGGVIGLHMVVHVVVIVMGNDQIRLHFPYHGGQAVDQAVVLGGDVQVVGVHAVVFWRQ